MCGSKGLFGKIFKAIGLAPDKPKAVDPQKAVAAAEKKAELQKAAAAEIAANKDLERRRKIKAGGRQSTILTGNDKLGS